MRKMEIEWHYYKRGSCFHSLLDAAKILCCRIMDYMGPPFLGRNMSWITLLV